MSLLSLVPSNGTDSDYPVDQYSCSLLGPTALVVQALMGVLVILSLVYKRHREAIKRPWRIWLLDVSKQIIGQMFVHGVNVLISDLGSHHSSGNACVFYFLNILVDTTLGVAVIYMILRLLNHVLTDNLQLPGFKSGQYGSPPSFGPWLRQAAVYVLALTTMKLLVVGLFALYPGIFKIGGWLLSWTRSGDHDAFQVIFTMGLFPIIMNILQFWLIDSIVKAAAESPVTLESDSQQNLYDDNDVRAPLFNVPSDDEDEDGPGPRHDIENPRSAREENKHNAGSTTSDELKSTGSSTSHAPIEGELSVTAHSYPPSMSPPSRRGSMSPPAVGSVHKYKRSVPAPLSLQTAHQPAINSPNPTTAKTPLSFQTMPEPAVPMILATVEADSSKDWESSWDDSDDWANKVGEDDWAKRREHKKAALSEAWTTSPLPRRVPAVGL